MAQPGLFDSAWMKWGQAFVHTKAFQADIKRVAAETDGKPASFAYSSEYDAKRHGFPIVVTAVKGNPTRWGLILGDIVNNFRSSLDHIAWALVARGETPGLPEEKARLVYYPLAKTPAQLHNDVPTRLPGVRAADLALVRRYQPYSDGKRTVPLHCLTILAELSRHDKHRTVQPLWIFPTSSRCEIPDRRDCIVTRIPTHSRGGLVKEGTELTCIYARKTGPEPYMKVNYNLTVQPAVNDRVGLYQWLARTGTLILRLLHEFSDEPVELRTLDVDLPAVLDHQPTSR